MTHNQQILDALRSRFADDKVGAIFITRPEAEALGIIEPLQPQRSEWPMDYKFPNTRTRTNDQ